jgi:hypothetical protein
MSRSLCRGLRPSSKPKKDDDDDGSFEDLDVEGAEEDDLSELYILDRLSRPQR